MTSLRPEEAASRSEDRSIIDVPEEPLLPPRPQHRAAPEPYPSARPPGGSVGFALAANRRNRRQPLVAAGATTRAA
ncbi:hypothetical protein I552_0091 [Mycobacterium xenopi 3993]|nr:hypothetical protein I552_0091 [Mycobacterium xenopi 3993]